jgi:hypothetical protein
VNEDDWQFLRTLGVPAAPDLEGGEPAPVSRFAEPASSPGLEAAREWAEQHGFGTKDTKEAQHMVTPGSSGPIGRAEALSVATRLARLPQSARREVLAARQRQVGAQKFRQEAAAIQRAARELDQGAPAPLVGAGAPASAALGIPPSVPPASPGDSAYAAVLHKSGVRHPGSRYGSGADGPRLTR